MNANYNKLSKSIRTTVARLLCGQNHKQFDDEPSILPRVGWLDISQQDLDDLATILVYTSQEHLNPYWRRVLLEVLRHEVMRAEFRKSFRKALVSEAEFRSDEHLVSAYRQCYASRNLRNEIGLDHVTASAMTDDLELNPNLCTILGEIIGNSDSGSAQYFGHLSQEGIAQ